MSSWAYLVGAFLCFGFFLFLLILFIVVGVKHWKEIKKELPEKQPKRWKTGLPFIDGLK